MIKQSYIDNDSILKKKFKILRMSILLGNSLNREETLKEYEETAKEIDKYQKDVYEEILSSKMYTTTTLEEEEKRLKDLITFIESRVDERNQFIDDYLKITNNFLDDLDHVLKEDELPEYQARYRNIKEYLDNVKEINMIKESLDVKRKELEEKYENKANNCLINEKLEEELIDEFNKLIIDDEYYQNLNYLDIDHVLKDNSSDIKDKKDVMETFLSSYEALLNAGISGAEREEYLSYVQDAKEDYYQSLEKEYLLKLYQLVLDKATDYDKLYQKRAKMEEIIDTRHHFRKELDIRTRDVLEYFISIFSQQFSIIKSQKFNMENIDKLILEITNLEERLDELEKNNHRAEILAILKEYSVTEPVIERVALPQEKTKNTQHSSLALKPNNVVLRITEPVKMDIQRVEDVARLVMKRVVIVLEPKRFNNRNKIKEAEEKIALEKQQEREKLADQLQKIDQDNQIGLELTRHDIFTDDDDDDIQVDLSPSKIVIPTEIVVTPPEEKTIDLFKEIDPFLDDNELEITSKKENTSKKDIPQIERIGTVKPNNLLDKITSVKEENKDIILPTMGIIDNEQSGVPIVSENYIN